MDNQTETQTKTREDDMARIPIGLSRVSTSAPVREQSRHYPSFITDYLSLASYLVACEHGVELRTAGKGTVLFSFFHAPTLSRDIEAFFGNSARVDPAKYDGARSQLRRQMEELRRRAR